MKPNNEQLTSAEMGKLWAVYMGNTMAICVLTYFQKHCQDPDIMEILKKRKAPVKKSLTTLRRFIIKKTSLFQLVLMLKKT